MKNIGIMIQTTASGILAYISAKLGILFPVLLVLGAMMVGDYISGMLASKKEALRSDWVLTGNDFHEGIRLVSAYADSGAPLQKKNVHLAEKYREWEQTQIAYENYLTDDAEIVLTAYGISARFVRSAIEVLRADGIKAGMVRPINVYPFPNEAYDKLDYSKLKGMLSVEMSIPELFVDDVRAAVAGWTKVETYATSGGVILDTNEIIRKAREICTKEAL